MSAEQARMCVLLPVADRLLWAVPQGAMVEVMTVVSDSPAPPARLSWRGADIPVLDIGAGGKAPWQMPRKGTGLVAVFHGLGEGPGAGCWGLAIRGEGLGFRDIVEADCEDRPEELRQNCLAAFAMDNDIFQVPDLPALQTRAYTSQNTAASA